MEGFKGIAFKVIALMRNNLDSILLDVEQTSSIPERIVEMWRNLGLFDIQNQMLGI